MLPLAMAGALGAVYVLPKAGATAESAAKMDLPGSSGGWWFENYQPSEAEIKTLGEGTDFSKALCKRPRPGEVGLDGYPVREYIDLSIVLSGHDLNSSIHRPERCMPAQGHRILDSRSVEMKVSNGHEFKAKRLKSIKLGKGEEKDSVVEYKCVTYYFFVGHDQITNDHLDRTFIDMQDRLIRGLDQRWAYVSASMMYGKLPWISKEVTIEEADEKLRKFLTEFAENQVNWQQVKP
jgi:Protein of unknown function (DUF3485)